MLQYLVILGAVVQLIGIVSYLKDTLTGRVKPNRVTWLLWSIAPMIATAAALSNGVRWAVLPVFMSGFGPFIIFLASFANSKSYWKLERFDYLCGFLSILALILWGLTKQANVAIIFAILSDLAAGLPTLIKSWTFPETETAWPYTTGIFNAVTGFAAISIWNFSALAFPIYLVIMNILLIIAVTLGKSRKRNRL